MKARKDFPPSQVIELGDVKVPANSLFFLFWHASRNVQVCHNSRILISTPSVSHLDIECCRLFVHTCRCLILALFFSKVAGSISTLDNVNFMSDEKSKPNKVSPIFPHLIPSLVERNKSMAWFFQCPIFVRDIHYSNHSITSRECCGNPSDLPLISREGLVDHKDFVSNLKIFPILSPLLPRSKIW